MSRNGVGRLIEIDTQGLSGGPEVEFLAPNRMPGIDQVRYKMRPERGGIWYLVLQAISFEEGISKIETIGRNNTCVACISYGGNAVFGKIDDPHTFVQIDVGTCTFLECFDNIMVAVGTLSIAKMRGDLSVLYYDHDLGYVSDIRINASGNLILRDENRRIGRTHEYDFRFEKRIREI